MIVGGGYEEPRMAPIAVRLAKFDVAVQIYGCKLSKKDSFAVRERTNTKYEGLRYSTIGLIHIMFTFLQLTVSRI